MLGGTQIGKALNISAEMVRQYAAEGRIPFALTPGGQRRYDLEDVKHALRMEKAQSFVPVGEGDEIRLSQNPADAPAVRRARGWRTAISAAIFEDAREGHRAGDRLRIPFIGQPGSSRFIIGQGARR